MAPALKVYRTAIGFHDAYVAAPSQKAALAAWGSDKNLFARGAAELVSDPALTEAPLAAPGTVIKRLRGTEAEQIAALPPERPHAKTAAAPATPKAKSAPKPSRAALAQAEAALADAEQRQDRDRAALEEREAALRAERHALDQAQREERERLARVLDQERESFERAMADWPG